MADIRISQLQSATSTLGADFIMVVQSGTNKKLTLATLLSKLDSPVTINSNMLDVNLTVHGTSPSLLCTNAQTNSVGIRTSTPEGAALQVIGDIRAGGTKVTTKPISNVVVGAVDSAGVGSGRRTVTVTTSETHLFSANDNIMVSGINIAALCGLFKVATPETTVFTYTVPNAVVPTGLTLNTATATKTRFYPGVIRESTEEFLVPLEEVGAVHQIDAAYSITGLMIGGGTTFLLSNGQQGQEKTIYLKQTSSTSDKATVNNVNGYGFNRIQFQKVGDAVTLIYDGSAWVCTGSNGAILSTV